MTLLCFPALLLIGSTMADQETPRVQSADPEMQKLADYAIAGLKVGRDRVRSGVYRVTGRIDPDPGQTAPGTADLEVFSAFDFDRDLFRFDRLVKRSPASNTLSRIGGRFVRTEQYTIQWEENSAQVLLAPPEEDAIIFVAPFDVRLVGLFNWTTLDQSGMGFEGLIRAFDHPVLHASKEGKSLYHLTWVFERSQIRWDLFLDSDQGFCPVRLETRRATTDGRLSEPREISEVTWKQLNDIWVPASYYQDRRATPPGRRELSFQWESVNQRVDESLFTWEGMGLAKGTAVIDVRLTRRPGVLIGHVGFPDRKKTAQQPQGHTVGWVVFALLPLTALLSVVLFYRLRSRRQSSSRGA